MSEQLLEHLYDGVVGAFSDIVKVRKDEALIICDPARRPTISVEIIRKFEIIANVDFDRRHSGPDHFVISISAGSFLVFLTLFHRAMLSPSFMPWVGDGQQGVVDAEQASWWEGLIKEWTWPGVDRDDQASRQDRLRRLLDAINRCRWESPKGLEPLPSYNLDPNWEIGFVQCFLADLERLSPARQEAALWLTHEAIRFVINHEIFHVLAGHVRYFNGSLGELGLVKHESKSTRNCSPEALRESRAIEAEADGGAAVFLCSFLATLLGDKHPETLAERQLLLEPWHVIYVLFFCINAYLFLYDPPWGEAKKQVTGPNDEYPSDSLRRWRLIIDSRRFLRATGLDWTTGVLKGDGTVHIGYPIEQYAEWDFSAMFGYNDSVMDRLNARRNNHESHSVASHEIDETLAALKAKIRELGYSYLPD
jgi:hypothetical protein